MSNKSRLLDAYGSSREIMHFDDNGDVIIQELHDVEPTIELAKAASEILGDKPADGMRLEAMIPAHVLNQAFREGWFHDKAAWKRWANDPGNKAFRVEHGGRVRSL